MKLTVTQVRRVRSAFMVRHRARHQKDRKNTKGSTKTVSFLKGLSCEERLKRKELPPPEGRRTRGQKTAVFRTMNGVDTFGGEDLFIWDAGVTRGHGKNKK